jgi:chromosome segregation ATPase
MLHHDAKAEAGSLRLRCSELQTASEASQTARATEVQSLAAEWEARMSQREAKLLSTQSALQGQLADAQLQLKRTSQQLAEATYTMHENHTAGSKVVEQLRSELANERERVQALTNESNQAARSRSAKDGEIRVLHEQVRCCKL